MVLYVNYKSMKRLGISVISIHGYSYEISPTKYRHKYVTDKGYIKSKTDEVVNPITYIDGYITTEDIDTSIVKLFKTLKDKLKNDTYYILGHYKVIQSINNMDLNKQGYHITTKLLSDATDFGMDIVTKIIDIAINNYNRTNKHIQTIHYSPNDINYFKAKNVRHNLLHHNHVYYNRDSDDYTHIQYGYKNEFHVGKPSGDGYYGIVRLDTIIPEIAHLRKMIMGISGPPCYVYTIKLRILYLNTYFRLYRIFGDDVYRFVYSVPDSKRDKSRMLRGIQMLDTLIVVAIEPPGLIRTAFKQLSVLESINKIYHLTTKSRDILSFKFIDIKDMFLTTKKNKKGGELIVYNDNLTEVTISITVDELKFDITVQIGIDILPKNNLKRFINTKHSKIELVLEKLGDRVFRQYTLIDTPNERLTQCAYYSGIRYVK